ncbi:pancreatic triacylglycerol lipase-like [Haematobia irritans]|uniref:pancreatic triacylglycerol lipase-like n=1 Tax=Haematobia irritans TaxID=7368 RepID=UPI003F4FB56D
MVDGIIPVIVEIPKKINPLKKIVQGYDTNARTRKKETQYGKIEYMLKTLVDFPDKPYQLDSLNISNELFEPRKPLVILIHGYTLNKDKSPNEELRPLLLEYTNVDVISVDYESLAPMPCYYPWAVENAKVVAKCLAQLLNSLILTELYTPNMIHIIGFSLGAQIAGLTANYIDFKLGKITGLDPAGWFFTWSSSENKLDPSDAEFVDIIHTDVYLFSDVNPMGHADFYPNLGPIRQPGCSFQEEPIFHVQITFFSGNCNHFRSVAYYAESITTHLGFWSYHCSNYIAYLLNQCQPYGCDQQLMGYYVSDKAKGSYFLTTNSASPFAKGPLVQIALEVSNAGNPNNDIINHNTSICKLIPNN